jgi:CopG family transcriptional regulator, nickel-responsive regulator
MRHLTISVDDDLADTFDRLVKEKGYASRSEAFRDLLRGAISDQRIEKESAKYCVGVLSYVYDHHERQLAKRLMSMQHDQSGVRHGHFNPIPIEIEPGKGKHHAHVHARPHT